MNKSSPLDYVRVFHSEPGRQHATIGAAKCNDRNIFFVTSEEGDQIDIVFQSLVRRQITQIFLILRIVVYNYCCFKYTVSKNALTANDLFPNGMDSP
jgi:hypothetical protein